MYKGCKKIKPIKMHFVKCSKYKISYIFEKTLVFSMLCVKCGDNNDRIFKERRDYWDITNSWFNWVNVSYVSNMLDEKVSSEFKLENIDKRRNYFIGA